MADLWTDEDIYWRENYRTRPYRPRSNLRLAERGLSLRRRGGESTSGPVVERC